MFTCLESAPIGNSVTCANNSEYPPPVRGVGKIVLTAALLLMVALSHCFDVLYVPGIRKNLLSLFALARIRLVVKFIDDKYIVHDLSAGVIQLWHQVHYVVNCISSILMIDVWKMWHV